MATQFGTYSLADIAAQLKGCDAYVAGRGSRPIIGDDEFTRYWTIDHALIERARSFADLYGDGDTFNADTPEVHHHVIVDPAAEQGVAQLGTWRVVRNFEDPDQKGKLFQTLRKGYLLPPTPPKEGGDVSWTALDAEARIWRVNEVDATLAGMLVPHYVILYPHVAKTHVHEFCAALLARPDIENPVFDEQAALAGTYKFTVVKNEEQDDGTSYVFAVIVSTEVPAGKEVQIYDGCAVSEWATFFYMLHTLPTVPASTSGIDYRLEGIAFDKELGLWECRLVKTETKTITIPQHTATQDLFEKRERAVWLGVRDGDKDHLGVSVPVEVPGIAASDGAIVSLARSKNKDCTQDLSQEREHELQLEDASRTEQKTIFETNVEQTDKAMPASTDVTVPAAADGVVVRKSVSKTRADKRTISTRTDTEQPVTEAQKSETRTLFDTRQSKLDKAQPLATDLTVPAASGGVVVTKRGAKTPGALLDVTTDTDTEQPVTEAQKSETRTLFDTRQSKLDKAQPLATDLTAPAASGGVVVTKRGAKTPGALLDVTTDTDTEQPVSDAQKSETKTLFELRRSKVDKAQPLATDLTAPAASGGVVVTKRGVKTPGALLDVTTDTDTEQPVTEAERVFRKRAFSSHTHVVNRSQPAAPDDPVVPGTAQSVTRTPGDLVHVAVDSLEMIPWIKTYSVPSPRGALAVKDFGFYTDADFLSLLASLGSASDWDVSVGYDEGIDRWGGRISQRRSSNRTRVYWEEFYKTGVTEREVSIEHRNGKVYEVLTVFTYNMRCENDIDDLFNDYNNEPVKLNGSYIHPDWGNNRGTYKAVSAIKITNTVHTIASFEAWSAHSVGE